MGFLGDITLGGVKGVMEGVGTLAKDIRSAITGEISPEKKAELLQKANELESQGMQAQAEINKMEASHRSMFVAGWRPALGWICVCALGWGWIIGPIVQFIYPERQLPAIEIGQAISLVMGMLGLGALRSYEKKNSLTV